MIGDGSSLGLGMVGSFLVRTAGQAGEALLTQDFPDGGIAQGSAVGFEGAFDVIDRMVLLAQGNDQRLGGVGLGLRFRARLAWAKEVERLAAELAAQDAEGPGGVAEAAGDLPGGELFDEKGPQGFVLAVRGGLGFQEEPAFIG